jgi:DNA ligase-1
MKDEDDIIESRKGIPFQNFTQLKEQIKSLFSHLSPDFYFDGELYTNILDFEIISGLIRLSEKKCTPEDTVEINKIEYHIYDFVDINNPTMIYKDRLEFLNKFLSKNGKKCNLCKQVETIQIEKIEDVKTYHDKFVQEGYEGIMIRDQNGPYEVNKRSKYLQKFKEFMEEEFKIIGFHEGSGDEKGAIIWDCETKNKTPFAVRPKGTFESRKKLFNEASKHIGKLLTVIFQEYSADEVPRFPVGKGIRDIY